MSTPIQPTQPQPKKRRGCLIAVLVALGLLLLGILSMCGLAGAGINAAQKASDAEHTVVFEVTGDGPVANVTYISDAQMSTAQEQGAKLPWKKELKMKGVLIGLNMNAQNGLDSGKGKIACRITVDGKEVAKNESKGQGAIASCNAKS